MEKVVLTGVIDFEVLLQYDDLVLQPDVKQIDISDFSIKESEEDNWRYTYLWEETKPSLLATLVMNKDFSSIFVIDGSNVYSADKKTIVYSFNENAINIPEGTENIGMYAFCNNKTKKVIIPDGVKSIGELAFYMCENLISVDIPDSVETLGDAAFSMCDLKKVKLSNNLKEIPDGCFEYNNIEEITIPSSVKRIGSESFHCNFLNKVILPEGVESIGWNVFTHCNDYIYFPSTMREIEKDFFYEDPIDDPADCVPFIEVSTNNPIFFSKEGTLYKYDNPNEPYLGYSFKPHKQPIEEPEETVVFPKANDRNKKEYTSEEIYSMFPKYCKPLSDKENLFWIYDKDHNIIDRFLNKYINDGRAKNIMFSYNNFVIINSVVYSIDLKHVLLEESNGFSFKFCDNAGRIYAEKNGKSGCIDINNRIVIPFEYNYFYRPFDENGIAIVSKQSRGHTDYMYINSKNEIIGIFVDTVFKLHEKGFHIYKNHDMYGYAKQFGNDYSGAIYTDIHKIDETTIKVTIDCFECKVIKYY